MMRNALIIFIKYPEPGKVKTRLAKSVGFKRAAEMYRSLVEKNIAEIRPLLNSTCDCWIAYDPPDFENQMRQWLSDDFSFLAQHGEDLTQRLTNAYSEILSHGYKSVAVLGSDTLGLRRELIEKTFHGLKTYDIVVGPAKDGGYYLIGMNTFSSKIFEDISWSTDKVMAQTLTKIRDLKWDHFLLDELDDLDEIKNAEEQNMREK